MGMLAGLFGSGSSAMASAASSASDSRAAQDASKPQQAQNMQSMMDNGAGGLTAFDPSAGSRPRTQNALTTFYPMGY